MRQNHGALPRRRIRAELDRRDRAGADARGLTDRRNTNTDDPVTVTLSQAIGATDPLATGDYGKTLTIALSPTTP